ncbi:MAG: DinB family protein, partial [Roseiflexaceae bacterium]
MDISHLCTQLARAGQTILGLTEGIDDETARIRYRADAWSIVEVMCHLYDEEREDFRVRVMQPLTAPHLPIPGIAPEEWVHSRTYATQALSRVR